MNVYYSYITLRLGRLFISLPSPHTFLYSLTRSEMSVVASLTDPNAKIMLLD